MGEHSQTGAFEPSELNLSFMSLDEQTRSYYFHDDRILYCKAVVLHKMTAGCPGVPSLEDPCILEHIAEARRTMQRI